MAENGKRTGGRQYGVPMKTDNAYEVSKLKWLRELKGFSQASLADASGVNKRNIRGFERGEIDINKAAAITVYRLATALGVTMEQLIDP